MNAQAATGDAVAQLQNITTDEIPLAAFAVVARVKAETVSTSPAYKSLPRYRRGGRSYVKVADAIAFLMGRRFVPATRGKATRPAAKLPPGTA